MDFFNNYEYLQQQETIKISHYVIDYCKKKNIVLTNLKLLKLLYFINIRYMIFSNGKPIFQEEFSAWRHGPVLDSVYDYFKFGITSVNKEKIDKIIVFLGEDKIKSINETLDKYASVEAWDLVNKTHIKGGPWNVVFEKNKNEDMCFAKIKHSLIYDFYKDKNV